MTFLYVHRVDGCCCSEALAVIQILITQSADIQKIFAFGGAFEKIMSIVTQEGGIEGSIVVQESLTCVDTLLRFNVSNQVRRHSVVKHPAHTSHRTTFARSVSFRHCVLYSSFQPTCQTARQLRKNLRCNSGTRRKVRTVRLYSV